MERKFWHLAEPFPTKNPDFFSQLVPLARSLSSSSLLARSIGPGLVDPYQRLPLTNLVNQLKQVNQRSEISEAGISLA